MIDFQNLTAEQRAAVEEMKRIIKELKENFGYSDEQIAEAINKHIKSNTMALQLEGHVKQINPLETGEGKNGQWQKREFVLEFQDGNYPKILAITGMKDAADKIGQLKVGENIRAHFNLESREYNGRFYTEAKLWKYEIIGAAKTNTPEPQTQGGSDTQGDDQLPF